MSPEKILLGHVCIFSCVCPGGRLQNDGDCGRMVPMGRMRTWLCLALFFAVIAGGVCLWLKVERCSAQLLQPVNPIYNGYADLPDKTQGVQLTPFSVTGKDGRRVQACIVRADDKKNITPRQRALLERLDGDLPGQLKNVDFVLVCADWDHGIRSALPLAEQLAAAGVACVLWEPRGSVSARPYCTHGLLESQDVSAIIDALEEQAGHGGLMILGVGKQFGAELLLHAAASDAHLRAVAAIDTRASMSNRMKRSGTSMLIRELTGWRMKFLTGLEPFDIAAVQSIFRLPRQVPILLIFSGESDLNSLPEDSISLYTQLHPEQRSLATLRRPDDPADATTRNVSFTQKGGTREVQQQAEATLLQDADDIPAHILRWMHEKLPALLDLPPAASPTKQQQ